MWPFQKKKHKAVLLPWQVWAKNWREESGLNFTLEETLESKITAQENVTYWLIYQEEVLAILQGSKASAKMLIERMPIFNELYDRALCVTFVAPIPHVVEVFFDYQHYVLSLDNHNEKLFLWVKPHVYQAEDTPLIRDNPFFSNVIFYHMMVPRFVEQDKSLSWHITQSKEVALWQPKADWGLMQVTIQAKNPLFEMDFWLTWPQKGDTRDSWRNVIKRFCYYTTQTWVDAQIELIYKDVSESIALRNSLGVQGEIRYKEPYRLPILLLVSKERLMHLARDVYFCKGTTFWSCYHQLRAHLWHKNYRLIETTAVHGGIQLAKSHLPSVAEFLLFLPESEQDKILQNFIGIFYVDKARAIFSYQLSLDSKDIRWVTSDLFEHNLMAKFPRNIANNWPHLSPSHGLEEWKVLNEEVLCALVKRVRDGQLILSPLTKAWLTRWVSHPYQERYARKFEAKYRYFEAQWNLMPLGHKHRLLAKIHNGQWACIFALQPTFLEKMRPFVSRRRLSLMEEEMAYLQEQSERPYVEAVRVLQEITDLKY